MEALLQLVVCIGFYFFERRTERAFLFFDCDCGIFQINIKYKTYDGVSVLHQKADEINAIIKSGATFTNSTTNVRIKNVSIQNVTVIDGFSVLPMLIEYFSFTMRL